eukprot:12933802-Prorocentrum_lima.AAC.1
MAQEFTPFYNLEAPKFFAAIEEAMGSQEPGRLEVNNKLTLNFKCNDGMLATHGANNHNQYTVKT